MPLTKCPEWIYGTDIRSCREADARSIPSCTLISDKGQQGGVRLLVGGHDETARTGVKWLAVDPGYHTTSRLTDGDTGREVDAVA
jgi:hypothetical protein